MTTAAVDIPVAVTSASTHAPRTSRIVSIDIMRGIIMVLMAIDHVRVYSGVPPGGNTAGLFFTRWITHFCAPGFVFLAGTSIFLYARKLNDQRALDRFLLTRGLLLIVLEVTLILLCWRFTYSTSNMLAGVIWMLGWCMIVIIPITRLAPRTAAIVGIVVIALQTLLYPLSNALSIPGLWQFLYVGGPIRGNNVSLTVLYNIVPWIGVMAAGFGFGAVMQRDAAARRQFCLRVGLGLTIAFVVIATTIALFTSSAENTRPLLFRVLDQNKYRNSQLFLAMTLGPIIALLPLLESARGVATKFFETFGRVPLFYYLLHIPLIHALSLVAWQLRDGTTHSDWFTNAPFVEVPDDQRWSLGLLYLVFAIAIAILYPLCKAYANAKANNPKPWMRLI